MRKMIAGFVASIWLCLSIVSAASAATGSFDFSLADLTGKTYKLSSYQNKQPVLLFFWTTWCPFCLAKLKEMNLGYVGLEKDGVALLAINAGERRASVERLVRNLGIAYTVLLDDKNVASDNYHVIGVPTFILIDKKGEILYDGNEYPKAFIQNLVSK